MKPNILLIFADELRADHLGCFGHPVVQTPSLDRLAARGCRFDQCMITQPTCTPCRASVLTGCYPSAIRSRMVGCVTPDDPRFLPRVLGEAGYRTQSIGKIHLAPQGEEPQRVEATRTADGALDYYGFRDVDLVNGHGDRCFGNRYSAWLCERVPNLDQRRGGKQLLPHASKALAGRGLGPYSYELPLETHSSCYIADRAVEALEAAAEDTTPFFLHVSFPDPHHPFTVPEPYAGRYQPEDAVPPLPGLTEETAPTTLHWRTRAGLPANPVFHNGTKKDNVIGTPPCTYTEVDDDAWRQVRATSYGMISLLDDSVGRILEALDETGLSENTIVIFLSDHGDYLGDYGLVGKGFHYDCILRTPLLIAGPGIRSGAVLDGMASVVDIAPTLLDLAGVPEREAVQGVSMRSALCAGEPLPRKAVLTENDDDFVPMRVRTLTTRDWKISVYANQEQGELYDRRNDPCEQQNLWSDPAFAATRDSLKGLLLNEVLCSIDTANGRIQNPAPQVPKWPPGPA